MVTWLCTIAASVFELRSSCLSDVMFFQCVTATFSWKNMTRCILSVMLVSTVWVTWYNYLYLQDWKFVYFVGKGLSRAGLKVSSQQIVETRLFVALAFPWGCSSSSSCIPLYVELYLEHSQYNLWHQEEPITLYQTTVIKDALFGHFIM